MTVVGQGKRNYHCPLCGGKGHPSMRCPSRCSCLRDSEGYIETEDEDCPVHAPPYGDQDGQR